jgi:hypothetical protein
MRRSPVFGLLPAALLLAGCAAPLAPQAFTGTGPAFRPDRWFEGPVASSGLIEDAGGAATGRFATVSTGRHAPDGSFVLDQQLRYDDGRVTDRVWRLTAVDAHRYAGTLSDGVGPVTGEAYGPAFHLAYRLSLQPGNPLATVSVDQLMVLQGDNSVVNRLTLRKLGIVVAMVTEHFCRGPQARRCAGRVGP